VKSLSETPDLVRSPGSRVDPERLMTETDRIQEVIQANIALHTKVSVSYNTEPHFRPENIANVERKLKAVLEAAGSRRMLDLGCGTGFMINIAKKHVAEIHGVDVTQAMMDKVDTSGSAKIKLFRHDSGTFPAEPGSYDVVTSYSFLHHLFDIGPTLKTAATALKKGGKYYVDLDPNYYFWEQINKLERTAKYDPIVSREIEAVTYKDEDIQKEFGVDKDVFNKAEYGKSTLGGFTEEHLGKKLSQAGFSSYSFFYEWFIGQGSMINSELHTREQRFTYAAQVNELLQRAMPLSRSLFKYIGFVATR
jgi:SAM-dependent methyltransferase